MLLLRKSPMPLAALMLLWPAISGGAAQAQASTVPPGPVPSQIFTARKIFISNQPGALYVTPHSAQDDPYRPYNQFYAEVKSWGHYELVGSPVDADLILEISLSDRAVFANAMAQAELRTAYFMLVLRDPKSQTVLWWLAQPLQGANRAATGEKNYNDAMNVLLNNLKTLVNPAPAALDIKK